VERDHDDPVVEAAGVDDLGEVLVDVVLNALDLLGHAPGVVDDEDDVRGLLLQRRLRALRHAGARAAAGTRVASAAPAAPGVGASRARVAAPRARVGAACACIRAACTCIRAACACIRAALPRVAPALPRVASTAPSIAPSLPAGASVAACARVSARAPLTAAEEGALGLARLHAAGIRLAGTGHRRQQQRVAQALRGGRVAGGAGQAIRVAHARVERGLALLRDASLAEITDSTTRARLAALPRVAARTPRIGAAGARIGAACASIRAACARVAPALPRVGAARACVGASRARVGAPRARVGAAAPRGRAAGAGRRAAATGGRATAPAGATLAGAGAPRGGAAAAARVATSGGPRGAACGDGAAILRTVTAGAGEHEERGGEQGNSKGRSRRAHGKPHVIPNVTPVCPRCLPSARESP
jgi:hypothetical protein